MLPMRDGVQLHAVILRPAEVEAGETLPFLIDRTPYGVDDMDSEASTRASRSLRRAGTSSCSRTFAGGTSRRGSL